MYGELLRMLYILTHIRVQSGQGKFPTTLTILAAETSFTNAGLGPGFINELNGGR